MLTSNLRFQPAAGAAGVRSPAVLTTLPTTSRSSSVVAQAVTDATQQQQKQARSRQQQQPRQRQQQRRRGGGPFPPPLTSKPFVVRVAGRTSSVQGAAGAITKRLRTDDLIRVAAIDTASIPKAMLALTAANNMLAANSGQMVVFHPQLITDGAEAPKVPEGSVVMYTSQLMQGEVLTDNALLVTAGTDKRELAGAIAARIRLAAHTVLECHGSTAVATAIQAIALARRFLRTDRQDVACLIASGRKVLPPAQEPAAGAAAAAEAGAAVAGADAAAAAEAGAGAGAGPTQPGVSKYPALCHRLIVLECEPSRPRSLLIRSSQGLTDRLQPPVGTPATAAAAGDDAPPLAATGSS